MIRFPDSISIPVYIVFWSCQPSVYLPQFFFQILILRSSLGFRLFSFVSTCERKHAKLSLYIWFISLNMTSAVPAIFLKMTKFHLWLILYCAHAPYFPYTFIYWWSSSLIHALVTVNVAAIPVTVLVSLLHADFFPLGTHPGVLQPDII